MYPVSVWIICHQLSRVEKYNIIPTTYHNFFADYVYWWTRGAKFALKLPMPLTIQTLQKHPSPIS